MPKAFCSRGFAYEENGEYDKAIGDYTEAIRLNRQYADAYNNRGNSYFGCVKGVIALKSFCR